MYLPPHLDVERLIAVFYLTLLFVVIVGNDFPHPDRLREEEIVEVVKRTVLEINSTKKNTD
jgi:hypothetical protein